MASERQDFKEAAPEDALKPCAPGVGAEISKVAQLACAATGAKGCLVIYGSPLGDGSVWASGACAARQLDHALVLTKLIARWSPGTDGVIPIIHRATPSDVAVLRSLGIEIEDAARVALWRHTEGQSTISVAIVSAAAGEMTKAVAGLVAHSTSALIGGQDESHRAMFWRHEATRLRDSLVAVRGKAARTAREHRSETAANRRLIVNAGCGDLPALASALSKLGPFDGWILLAQEREGLQVKAVRGVPRDALSGSGNELRRMLDRPVTIAQKLGRGAVSSSTERLLRGLGYRACLSVPLEDAVLLLLARNPLTAVARARVANSRRTIAPHLRSLFLSRELERQRALVRSLVRGLFATADAERASLRRDLHDDWAQLLAAAQIAIDGNREDARRFFIQLRDELRKRLNALRPPNSHRGSLKGTIGAELRRLSQAGIQATASIHGHSRLPLTVKEVFSRVIGEGVSNVIRHAGADQVCIEVQCRDGVATATITDNGRRLGDRSVAAGFGLRGVAERVAIVGGSCDLEPLPDGTRLSARIPVADL